MIMKQVGGVGVSILLSLQQVLQMGPGYHLPFYIRVRCQSLFKMDKRWSCRSRLYGVSNSGWMEWNNFYEWFKKLYLPVVSPFCGWTPFSYIPRFNTPCTQLQHPPILFPTTPDTYPITPRRWGLWSSKKQILKDHHSITKCDISRQEITCKIKIA